MNVTDEMVAAARQAYWDECEVTTGNVGMRLALEAAIALMRGQSWQPIETAPKDRRILLFQGGVWKGGWDECERKWMGAGAGVFIVPPTHWQPLPTPPKDTADEQ